jgi:hypothetical protein
LLVCYRPLARYDIGNYTAEDSVGDAAPSPISPEPLCRKDTIRGGRVLDGGDACQVSEGESPAGVGTGSSELSRDEALDIVDMLRSSAGGESSRDDAARSSDLFDGGGAECACRTACVPGAPGAYPRRSGFEPAARASREAMQAAMRSPKSGRVCTSSAVRVQRKVFGYNLSRPRRSMTAHASALAPLRSR